jgi:1,2-diacylglycerol 3-alpha-glucosyltransferase
MKIVFATDQYWPTISGVPVSIDTFKNELQKLGNEVYILAPDHPGASELDQKMKHNNTYRFRSFTFNKENRLVFWTEKKSIFRTMDSIKPDIIHIQTEFTLANIAISYAKKNNIPLVMTAHTNWEDLVALYVPFLPTTIARMYCRFKMRRILNKIDIILVPTSLMEVLLNLYFVKKPIRIIPTGIDKDEFCVEKIKNNKIIDEIYNDFPKLKGHKVLLFVGRIGKEKNIPFLFEVLKNLRDKNAYLVIIGDGPAKEELINLSKDMYLQNNIIFTGYIERKKLKAYYSIADVFVFASKVESQGLVVLESMACGTPVVAIGKMGTREVMNGDSGGYMVDDDLDEFTAKVRLLLYNDKIKKYKSKEALAHVENWTINLMSEKLNKLYISMINHSKKKL